MPRKDVYIRREVLFMLKIIYGKTDAIIRCPSVYFNNTYEPEWLNDEFVKEMIRDVDKSEVIGPRLINSPFLGPISPKELSGGVKTLILMLKDDKKVFYASACGDNCSKWILEIAKQKDLVINLRHIMDFGEGPFDIYFENSKTHVHYNYEYLDAILDIEERE